MVKRKTNYGNNGFSISKKPKETSVVGHKKKKKENMRGKKRRRERENGKEAGGQVRKCAGLKGGGDTGTRARNAR